MAATASRGRKAKPTHLRLVEGQGPGRDGEPRDSGGRPLPATPEFARALPTKPDDLSLDDDASWLWDMVIDQMGAGKLLKPLDGPSLEVMCHTFARWRQAVRQRSAHGLTDENSQGTRAAPWVGIEERASKEFRSWCAEYGITPAAEKNLRASDEGNGNESNPYA